MRQGCVLAPAIFSIAIDWIQWHVSVKPEIAVGHDHFSDLVYADDTALFVNSASEAVACLDSFKETAAELGLRLSWPKQPQIMIKICTKYDMYKIAYFKKPKIWTYEIKS